MNQRKTGLKNGCHGNILYNIESGHCHQWATPCSHTLELLFLGLEFLQNFCTLFLMLSSYMILCAVGIQWYHCDQIHWSVHIGLLQVATVLCVLLPNVHIHGHHWCRPRPHIPPSAAELYRYEIIGISPVVTIPFFEGPPYYPVKTRSPYPPARSDIQQDSTANRPYSSVDDKAYPDPTYPKSNKNGSSIYPQIPSERAPLLGND